MLNLTHRESREHPAPLEPGTAYRASVELEVTSWVFEQGHRIRLDVAGTDWPNAWSPPAPVTLTIERTGSALILPALDGPSPIPERPALPPSLRQQQGHVSAKGHHLEGVTWRIEHDVLARETRAVVENHATSEADGERPRFREYYGGTVSVSTVDPGKGRAESRSTFTVEWPEATVETEAQQVVESDADAYHLTIELDVSEKAERLWSRRWDRRIPRRLQ
jgi:hypothetical protein